MQGYREGKIRYVASEIERMADDLELSEQLTKGALRLFAQVLKQEITINRLDDVSVACLYGAIRTQPTDAGATFHDVASVARIEDSRIQTVSTRIFTELGLKVPPPDPRPTLVDACETLDIDDADVLLQVLDELEGEVVNKAPTTLVGSVIFAGQYLKGCSYDVTQEAVAEVVGSTQVSLRSVYKVVLQQVHENMDYPIEEHRFSTREHGLAVIQDTCDVTEAVVTEAKSILAENGDRGAGSLEGIVCAATYLAARESDNSQLSVEELTDEVGVTARTVNRYIEQMGGVQ